MQHVVAVAVQAKVLSFTGPRWLSKVMMSAMIWQGWVSSVRPLMTGTVACSASLHQAAVVRVVRIMMAST